MIQKLRLKNFKNFGNVELQLGPFTTIIGTNASGKSNLRDAFRFLHGISRGYNLAEIVGEKSGPSGVPEWEGIRGGTRELATHGKKIFALEAEVVKAFFSIKAANHIERVARYEIRAFAGDSSRSPRVFAESLSIAGESVFRGRRHADEGFNNILGTTKAPRSFFGRRGNLPMMSRVSGEIPRGDPLRLERVLAVRQFKNVIRSTRFLDLSPSSMRNPSVPGAITLGDRGENLSSVLQHICDDPGKKSILLEWVKELTPMDAVDFEFPADQIGRILVTLVEADGGRTSAYSASDGTLRFLAMIAAMLGPEDATFYFFEEMENGIHPTRLHLLINLIEQTVRDRKIQIVATSHSPSMLRYLSEESLEFASLVYRPPGSKLAQIKRVVDIEGARDLIKKQDLGRLLDSGWLEDAMFFAGDNGEGAEGVQP